MTPLIVSDLVALVIVVVAALALLLNLLVQHRHNRLGLKATPAVSAISAFQQKAAEEGKRLTFGLGEGFSDRSISLNSLVGLTVWRDAAARAVFNDQPTQAVTGNGSLNMISQMVLHGVYQNAMAVELFKPEQVFLAGVSEAASVAGLIPGVNQEANSAVAMIGTFSPLAGLAANLATRKQMSIVGMADTLNAQATFFVTTPLSTLGEDLFSAEQGLSRRPEESSQLRAQDWLRVAGILALVVGALLKLTGVMP